MVNVSIVASGTRGDVQPYVALGQGLQQVGYRVRVLTNENFESLVTEAGLGFASTGENIEAIIQSEEWRKTTESGNFIKILGKMQSEMKRHAARIAQTLPDLIKGSDLLITGMGGIGGIYALAEMLHIPVIQAYVFPFTPTGEFPAPLVPKLPLGGAVNRLSFRIVRQMFWQNSKVADTAIRQAVGMGKGSFWGPFGSLQRHHVPALYGFSRYVLPRPQDWPKNHLVTGYWYLDAPDNWAPPTDLVEFLNAGKAPVYIGFGSMINSNPEEAGKIALEALERSGQRGIIASGWGGLKPSQLPDTVYAISSIPHSWLFPRMAAVVHHGGAGTTSAGLRAGIPSIIIPFMGDQPFWGKRVADLGVGTNPIPRKKLTSENLAAAISDAVSNTTMQQKAARLGQNIRDEDGIGKAVSLIEQFSQSLGVAQPSSSAVSS
ncbi:MAG: glycosyltransferase family 1 protein [Anaerolineae bacterium]|nr:glycosyltransferase family 1 protein [Anaerolineae bacterium]